MSLFWNPRKEDVERFTRGDCHILARAINLKTNWPIHIFCEPAPEGNHAWILTPEGYALDINGYQKVSFLMEEWRVTKHKKVTYKKIVGKPNHWGGSQFGKYSFQRAEQMADRLLALDRTIIRDRFHA